MWQELPRLEIQDPVPDVQHPRIRVEDLGLHLHLAAAPDDDRLPGADALRLLGPGADGFLDLLVGDPIGLLVDGFDGAQGEPKNLLPLVHVPAIPVPEVPDALGWAVPELVAVVLDESRDVARIGESKKAFIFRLWICGGSFGRRGSASARLFDLRGDLDLRRARQRSCGGPEGLERLVLGLSLDPLRLLHVRDVPALPRDHPVHELQRAALGACRFHRVAGSPQRLLDLIVRDLRAAEHDQIHRLQQRLVPTLENVGGTLLRKRLTCEDAPRKLLALVRLRSGASQRLADRVGLQVDALHIGKGSRGLLGRRKELLDPRLRKLREGAVPGRVLLLPGVSTPREVPRGRKYRHLAMHQHVNALRLLAFCSLETGGEHEKQMQATASGECRHGLRERPQAGLQRLQGRRAAVSRVNVQGPHAEGSTAHQEPQVGLVWGLLEQREVLFGRALHPAREHPRVLPSVGVVLAAGDVAAGAEAFSRQGVQRHHRQTGVGKPAKLFKHVGDHSAPEGRKSPALARSSETRHRSEQRAATLQRKFQGERLLVKGGGDVKARYPTERSGVKGSSLETVRTGVGTGVEVFGTGVAFSRGGQPQPNGPNRIENHLFANPFNTLSLLFIPQPFDDL